MIEGMAETGAGAAQAAAETGGAVMSAAGNVAETAGGAFEAGASAAQSTVETGTSAFSAASETVAETGEVVSTSVAEGSAVFGNAADVLPQAPEVSIDAALPAENPMDSVVENGRDGVDDAEGLAAEAVAAPEAQEVPTASAPEIVEPEPAPVESQASAQEAENQRRIEELREELNDDKKSEQKSQKQENAEDPRDKIIRELREENAALRVKLAQYE